MIPIHFSQVIGNEFIKNYLTRIVRKKAISHSFLFVGPDGIGKSLFAHILAALVIGEQDEKGVHRSRLEKGNHPDIHIYRPEGKLGLHSIQTMRQLREEVYLPPYEAAWKVFIIHEADRMLSYSANALLKTFEEPPHQTLIILLSHASSSLLPTILSRCRQLHFQALTQQEIKNFLEIKYQLEASQASSIAYLAHGSLSRAVYLVEKGGDPNRQLILKILSQHQLGTYKALTSHVQLLVEQIETIKKQREETAKEELYKIPTEDLSSSQQHALEKELEGVVAMSQVNEINALLENVLSWYRDLHLLHMNGPSVYVINQDYYPELERAVQKGHLLSLEKVQKAIEQARLALQRSTSLSICLENLFLKLNLISHYASSE
jgi:DNA polymerase-3 subunit delta'